MPEEEADSDHRPPPPPAPQATQLLVLTGEGKVMSTQQNQVGQEGSGDRADCIRKTQGFFLQKLVR